jgi:hypothetical protein
MMRRLALVFLPMLMAGLTLNASEGTMPVSKAVVSEEVLAVVAGQLAAFRTPDLPKAYAYASIALRAQTPLPAFVRMVQRTYPEIWANTRAEFGVVRDDGRRAKLVVQVFAKEAVATYDYVLFKEEDGWRIGSVLRREARKAESL